MRPVVRTAVVRAALWKLRWQLRRDGRHEDADKVTQVLRDREALEAVAESICVRFAQENPEISGLGDWVDEITKLIQWIIDHADEIIALIIKIIALFDTAAIAPCAPCGPGHVPLSYAVAA
jgi:hypothetical protein